MRPLCLLFPTDSFVFAELSTYYVPGLGDWGGRWGNKKRMECRSCPPPLQKEEKEEMHTELISGELTAGRPGVF